jgi:hypothetical protein
MLPSIDTPQGDQVDRTPATTANSTPTTRTGSAIAPPSGELLVEERVAQQ